MDELRLGPPTSVAERYCFLHKHNAGFLLHALGVQESPAWPLTPITGHRSSNEFLDYESHPHPMQTQKHSPKPHVKLVGL